MQVTRNFPGPGGGSGGGGLVTVDKTAGVRQEFAIPGNWCHHTVKYYNTRLVFQICPIKLLPLYPASPRISNKSKSISLVPLFEKII